MLRSKTVEPGWYKCLVKDVTRDSASTDGSTLAVIDFIITQEGPFQGVPMKRFFSEKAMGFSIPFFAACGAPIKEEGGSYDFAKTKGKTILVYVKNEMYQNRMTNKPEDFKAIA
jgi:hypothetical protein